MDQLVGLPHLELWRTSCMISVAGRVPMPMLLANNLGIFQTIPVPRRELVPILSSAGYALALNGPSTFNSLLWSLYGYTRKALTHSCQTHMDRGVLWIQQNGARPSLPFLLRNSVLAWATLINPHKSRHNFKTAEDACPGFRVFVFLCQCHLERV